MRVLILVLLFLSGCSSKKTPDPQVKLQRDIYKRVNQCGGDLTNLLNVLSLSFIVPKPLAKDLEIVVHETLSNNKQSIFFDGQRFFYPGLFKPGGHYEEHNNPECDNQSCQFNIFVFTDQWSTLSSELKIKLMLNQQQDKILLDFPMVKNRFAQLKEIFRPDLKVFYQNQEALVSLSKENIQKLLKDGIREVELVIQWKDENGKSNEAFKIFQLHENTSTLIYTHKITNPSYIGGMIIYQMEDIFFESKVEIMNLKDSFYQCK